MLLFNHLHTCLPSMFAMVFYQMHNSPWMSKIEMLGQGCIQGVHRPGQIAHTLIPVPARSLRKNGRNTEGVKRQYRWGHNRAF